jgi:hypothetical protein
MTHHVILDAGVESDVAALFYHMKRGFIWAAFSFGSCWFTHGAGNRGGVRGAWGRLRPPQNQREPSFFRCAIEKAKGNEESK